jgi:hypothetical protein
MRQRWNSRPTLVLLIVLSVLTLSGPATARDASPGTITVIGDIHGDFDDLVSLLQHCGLIDAQRHWTGDKATLIQIGDVLDRGPKPREALDLLMALQKEAAKKGGRVVVLLGNHEVMNMMGDLRYVTPQNYASFAGDNSQKLQHAAYEKYLHWRKDHQALVASMPETFPDASEAEWTAGHPAGYIEQREAFSPGGKYGKWLRDRPAILELNHIVFVHGGVDPSLSSMSLEDMDRRVHQEISAFDQTMQLLVAQQIVLPFFTLQEISAVIQAELSPPNPRPAGPTGQQGQPPTDSQLQMMRGLLQYGQWLSMASNGPLWFRGYDEWSDAQLAAELPKMLAAYRATAIVVAHTPQRDRRIRSRLGGKVFLIDTGMLSSYYPQGRASALQIRDGVTFTAQYMDQQVVLSGEAKP